ncbi:MULTISPECIES: ABC transporter substrate-binding protein [unclassified Curtobacterium]|uniref:ABC transporter substrate-binding protein n=1 Tax=unclassified Curtobacterium TaxID=257496 RepID=UPI00104C762E|nr:MULTISPECIES: ABC transporter substrate-binding protein [unclassified Curtobacterium]TCL79747.1 peptide/nickel transport system substrate-binding protein [Curtobacterium sp. PhB128]TCL98079.1 peptide/nickel transport system substrate-binding protein [Curtobacterium sp. PhB138]TCU50030.1 peptide/nickel transport system substrate-binding protein [Curtobacterium sp. PhB146]TCU87671.1 peptide/nickel transport system substrate-binding protein [Curtobacterium sp. PhB191]TDW46236.1 peptide/nickel 
MASPRIHRLLAAVGLTGTAALVLTGCSGFSSADTGSGSTTKDTVTAALTAEPSTLDPVFDTNLQSLNVFENVFDQLTTIGADGSVEPGLATEWTHDDALTTWTFTLRDDAEFSDGSPVTADDVVYTYETAMKDPESNLGGYMTAIDSLEATDDTTVVFHLNTAYAPFDRQVTLVSILPEAIYAEGAKAFGQKPVGSGPYEVVKWTRGDSITLKRNPDYWGKQGTYENVVFQFVPDETTRANSVQSGDLDIALLGPASVDTAESSDAIDVVDTKSNRVIYTGFNATAKWLDDADFRKAVSLAVDRDAISEKLMAGTTEPASQLVASVTQGYDDSIEPTEQDVAKAKQLVEASGYDGSAITLSYPTTTLPQIQQLAQSIQQYLEAVGITVELDGQEFSTFSSNWFSNKFSGLYIYAFAPSVLDADLPLTMLTKSGGQGYAKNAEIDALLEKELAEPDEDARNADLGQVSAIVDENTYYAPLIADTYTYGVTKGLDWTPRPNGMILFN